MAAAYSHELPRYGIKVGLTNWAAAYATGLLCARRVLAKLGLDEQYEGQVEPTGEHFEVEQEGEKKPFKAYLDTGLARSTTGGRIFACLKGAADGGVLIPHSESRFPGYDKSSKEADAELVAKYILGGHVAEYMEELQEDDEEAFKRQFASYLAEGLTADDIEDMYKEAHAKIRENPVAELKEKWTAEQKAAAKKYKMQPRNLKQRRDRVKQKKASFLKKLAAEDN